jgi:hypothetical protein
MINAQALERLKGASFTPQIITGLLEQLAGVIEIMGSHTSQFQLDYQHAADTIEPGDMIPFITIGLRPATEVPSDGD